MYSLSRDTYKIILRYAKNPRDLKNLLAVSKFLDINDQDIIYKSINLAVAGNMDILKALPTVQSIILGHKLKSYSTLLTSDNAKDLYEQMIQQLEL